ncbi:MAG: hypothetical protein JRJ48_06085 [Deltaproteobacteria bacterium]|nr:hypothetical protein [Deltaproteobacteria bacterium]
MAAASDLTPTFPWYLFIRSELEDASEYLSMPSLHDAFYTKSTCIQTSRDSFVIGFEPLEVETRVAALADPTVSDDVLRRDYGLKDGRNWKLAIAREDIANTPGWRDSIVPFHYRAFDTRFLCCRDSLVNWPRHEVMDHLSGNNVALLLPRQLAGSEYRHVFVSRTLSEMCVVSTATKEQVQAHPLFLLSSGDLLDADAGISRTNFTESFVNEACQALRLEWSENRDWFLSTGASVSSVDLFCYAYAILQSPKYRRRYAAFLRIDFPRLPFPASTELFRVLATLGMELISLHLLESSQLDTPTTQVMGSGSLCVQNVAYSNETAWLDKAQTKGFQGISPAVWAFHIGGYQVCEKWLKDRQAKGGKNPRPGRILTNADIAHYQKIIVAIKETIRIMTEIDEVIEQHGGWPGAFATTATDGKTATCPEDEPEVKKAAEGRTDYGQRKK